MPSLANMRKGKPPPRYLYAQAEKKRGLPRGVLRGVAQVESKENPNAVDPSGTVGLMQITRRTGHAYGLKDREWKNPARQIDTAGDILSDYSARRDMPTALRKYNGGQDPAYAVKVLDAARLPVPSDHPATTSFAPGDEPVVDQSLVPSLTGMRVDPDRRVGEGMPMQMMRRQ